MTTPTTGRTDFERYVRLLRRHGLLIALSTVVALVGAYGWTATRDKKYTATASLLFRNPELAQQVFGSSSVDAATDPARDAATDVGLVSLAVVASKTAASLGGGLTTSDIQNLISVQGGGQSDIVTVGATTVDPRASARVANSFARNFVAFRRDADREKIAGALNVVEAQLNSPSFRDPAERRDLQDRAQQLRILVALQTGNVELIQPARVPTIQSSPRPRRDTALGGVLGLLFGLSLALARDRLDRRIRDVDELTEVYGLPLLGRIPSSRALRDDIDQDLPHAEAEAFRMVRAALRYFKIDRPIRSVLVTSASPGEGKSTIAWNLASATVGFRDTRADKTTSRVLLVEADLRRPSMALTHGLRQGPGLSELIAHDLPITKVVQRVPIGDPDVHGETAYLDVITAGHAAPNPAALLQSAAAAQLLAMFASLYELVVVDTPPAAVVADAIPLMRQVSGVVVVGRIGMSRRDHVNRLREQLSNVGAPMLGVIANGVSDSRSTYYEYYGLDEEAGAEAAAGVPNGRPRRAPPVDLDIDFEYEDAPEHPRRRRPRA